MVDLKVVITGTGRCGTVFMANLLTDMGWPCGHEAVFGPHGIERAKEILAGRLPAQSSSISKSSFLLSEGMNLMADSSYMAAPFLKEINATIIHLVRNPIKVVSSLVGDFFMNFSGTKPIEFENEPDHFLYESFMYKHLPELEQEMSQIDRGCLFYIRWNELIESSGKVDLFHRIEDPPEKIKKLLGFSGSCQAEADTKCNSFAWCSLSWNLDQIETPWIRSAMRDIMKRYGYRQELKIF